MIKRLLCTLEPHYICGFFLDAMSESVTAEDCSGNHVYENVKLYYYMRFFRVRRYSMLFRLNCWLNKGDALFPVRSSVV